MGFPNSVLDCKEKSMQAMQLALFGMFSRPRDPFPFSVQFPIVDQFSAEQPSRIEKGIHAHVLW